VGRLIRSLDFSRTLNVVELGMGTGCVTRALLKRMRPDARLISLEINEIFVQQCRSIRDPRLVIRHSCASLLPQLLEEEGLEEVDVVVSSLPLALMNDEVVDRIVEASSVSLRPGGSFLQYQYSLKHLPTLNRHYSDVRIGFMPYNVPPAFVLECSDDAGADRRESRSRPWVAWLYAGMLSAVSLGVRALQDL
jgi:phospholipid N-methyltransferase